MGNKLYQDAEANIILSEPTDVIENEERRLSNGSVMNHTQQHDGNLNLILS